MSATPNKNFDSDFSRRTPVEIKLGQTRPAFKKSVHSHLHPFIVIEEKEIAFSIYMCTTETSLLICTLPTWKLALSQEKL